MKNPKVVILSILALGFLALTFLIDWLFIIRAVIILLFLDMTYYKANFKFGIYQIDKG